MSLPPRPWHYETTALAGQADGSGHVYLVDANGKKRASIWGPAADKIALAEFIIAASEAPAADDSNQSRDGAA